MIETSRAYGRGLIKGISRFAQEQGNWSLHFEDRSLHDRLPIWLKNWQGDGIIARTATAAQHNMIQRRKIPSVELFGATFPEVGCDDQQIGLMAAEHFIERGILHFAFFAPEMPWWCRQRYEQFNHCLSLYGLTSECFERCRKGTGHLSPSWDTNDERLLRNWLMKLPKPVGIFAATDAYSLTVLGVCRRHGISVPEEAAILGADNDLTICLSVTPQLSSIDVNNVLTGYTAAKLLQDRMEKNETDVEIPVLIPPAYVVTRQSTDMIAIDDEDVITALAYLRKHALSGVAVTEIADVAGLSLSTLTRRFRKYFGHSPEQEIIRYRINRAKRYLRETELPVHLIGKKTGFTPAEYFVRAFKREVGKTPNQYRKLFLPHADVGDE